MAPGRARRIARGQLRLRRHRRLLRDAVRHRLPEARRVRPRLRRPPRARAARGRGIAHEGHARLESGGCRTRDRQPVRRGALGEVHRPAEGPVCALPVRRGTAGREPCRPLHGLRVRLHGEGDDLARPRRRGRGPSPVPRSSSCGARSRIRRSLRSSRTSRPRSAPPSRRSRSATTPGAPTGPDPRPLSSM